MRSICWVVLLQNQPKITSNKNKNGELAVNITWGCGIGKESPSHLEYTHPELSIFHNLSRKHLEGTNFTATSQGLNLKPPGMLWRSGREPLHTLASNGSCNMYLELQKQTRDCSYRTAPLSFVLPLCAALKPLTPLQPQHDVSEAVRIIPMLSEVSRVRTRSLGKLTD